MKRNSKGFTLVEVIVVLVVLAILAAIMIPAMTGWINRAKIRVCQNDMAFVKRSYMSLAAFEKYSVASPKELLAECVEEAKGDGNSVSSDAKKYDAHCGGECTVFYAAGNAEISSIVCSIHGWLGGSIAGLVPGSDPTGTFNDALQSAIASSGRPVGDAFRVAIDSTAPDGGTGFTKAIVDYFKNHEPPIDLSVIGIKSWSLQKTEGRTVLWWTDQNIAEYAPGDVVKVMRYDETAGTYTAGYITVKQRRVDGTRYNAIARPGDEGALDTLFTELPGQDDTKLDYDAALELFNGMPATPQTP